MPRPLHPTARAAGLAGLLLAVACASPPTPEDYELAIAKTALEVEDLPPGAQLVPVYAESEAEALRGVVRAIGARPSDLSRTLARAFDENAAREVGFAVGGPYDALNERVLLDAFSLVRARDLSGIYVLYVSPEPPTSELLRAARALGARVGHRRFEFLPQP